MPFNKNISYSSIEFMALLNNDIDFVSRNFHLYEKLKDYWLTVASCYSNLEMNQLFLDSGANPNFNGSENFTNAIFQNNLDVVKLYVSHNCILLGEDSDHLGGAVMSAINHDNLEMLKYLIGLGCDIHLNDNYAFNRGIAENSIHCITYLVENYKMSYNPDIDYNIQKIISENHYQIFDYILNLIAQPFQFNFSNSINHLLSKGHPEVFDLFVKYDFLNESIFIDNFESLLYFFPSQQKLYQHLENQYPDWLLAAKNKKIDDSKLERLLDFVISQKYSDKEVSHSMSTALIETLKNIPFIYSFTEKKSFIISDILIQNIDNQNNIDLLHYFYQSEDIQQDKIQQTLDNILPSLIEKPYFNDLLLTLFKDSFQTELPNLSKIYSYFKLDILMDKKAKTKIKKI